MSKPQPKAPRERRRHSRPSLKIPVDYSSVDAFFSEFSQNINEGGMFIEMEEPPALETPVQLQFCLPGEPQPLRVQGRVAWVRERKPDAPEGPAGVGIEFQNLDQETRDTINRIVRQLRDGGGEQRSPFKRRSTDR
jgi:uncharacterized protein (TIGR02266 family)